MADLLIWGIVIGIVGFIALLTALIVTYGGKEVDIDRGEERSGGSVSWEWTWSHVSGYAAIFLVVGVLAVVYAMSLTVVGQYGIAPYLVGIVGVGLAITSFIAIAITSQDQ